MLTREFKKLLFSATKNIDFNKVVETTAGRVDLWKNSLSQNPLLVVKMKRNVGHKWTFLILSSDISNLTTSKGVSKTQHAPQSISTKDFTNWFANNYATEQDAICFEVDGKIYAKADKIQYSDIDGNLNIYLKEK